MTNLTKFQRYIVKWLKETIDLNKGSIQSIDGVIKPVEDSIITITFAPPFKYKPLNRIKATKL